MAGKQKEWESKGAKVGVEETEDGVERQGREGGKVIMDIERQV